MAANEDQRYSKNIYGSPLPEVLCSPSPHFRDASSSGGSSTIYTETVDPTKQYSKSKSVTLSKEDAEGHGRAPAKAGDTSADQDDEGDGLHQDSHSSSSPSEDEASSE